MARSLPGRAAGPRPVRGRQLRGRRRTPRRTSRWNGCNETGRVFCYGDGSGAACPCGNASTAGDRAGCAHSFGFGATLRASGEPSLSDDTLVLNGAAMPASTACCTSKARASSGAVRALHSATGCDVRAVRMCAWARRRTRRVLPAFLQPATLDLDQGQRPRARCPSLSGALPQLSRVLHGRDVQLHECRRDPVGELTGRGAG